MTMARECILLIVVNVVTWIVQLFYFLRGDAYLRRWASTLTVFCWLITGVVLLSGGGTYGLRHYWYGWVPASSYTQMLLMLWGFLTAQVFIGVRYRAHSVNALVQMFVWVAIVFACVSLRKTNSPPSPFELSFWFLAQAWLSAIGTGFFSQAGASALLYLVKSRTRVVSVIAMNALCVVISGILLSQHRELTRGFLFAGSTSVFVGAVAILIYWLGGTSAGSSKQISKDSEEESRDEVRWQWFDGLFIVQACAVLGQLYPLIFGGSGGSSGVGLGGGPGLSMAAAIGYGVIALACVAVAAGPHFWFLVKDQLAEPAKLDRWSYLGVLLGFSFQSAALICVTIWSWFYQGRLNWISGENATSSTGVVLSWLLFNGYLHYRVKDRSHGMDRSAELQNWRAALIAVTGFFLTVGVSLSNISRTRADGPEAARQNLAHQELKQNVEVELARDSRGSRATQDQDLEGRASR